MSSADAQAIGEVRADADAAELAMFFLTGLFALLAPAYARWQRCKPLCDNHRQRNGEHDERHTVEGYRDFLARRDGEADLLNRRLANREQFFNGLEANPVRSAHPADRPTVPPKPAPPTTRTRPGQEDAVPAGHRQAEPGRTVRSRTRRNLRAQQRRESATRERSTSNSKSTTTPGCSPMHSTCLT